MTEPELPTASEVSVRRRVGLTGWGLLAFAGLLLAGVMLTGWEDALVALSALGPGKLVILLLLALAHYLIRALRWHILVRTAGVQTSWTTNALHFFGGFAMTATPGRVGELVRLRWLMRATGRGFGHLLPIAFADRAIELASIVGLIALCLVATSLGSSAVWWVLVVGGTIVWIACRPTALLVAVNTLYLLAGRRRPRIFVKLRRLTRRLDSFMRLHIFLPVVALGMVGWGFEGMAFWLLLDWLGAGIGVATATAIFLTAVLSGALSGLTGGAGGHRGHYGGIDAVAGRSVGQRHFGDGCNSYCDALVCGDHHRHHHPGGGDPASGRHHVRGGRDGAGYSHGRYFQGRHLFSAGLCHLCAGTNAFSGPGAVFTQYDQVI